MRSLAPRFAVFAILMALAVDVRAQSLGSAESSEHLIKAGYVYNFAKLVEWPPAEAPKGQPIVIGGLGNDDFATAPSLVVEGKRVDDLPFEIRRLKSKDFRECVCRILFVAA